MSIKFHLQNITLLGSLNLRLIEINPSPWSKENVQNVQKYWEVLTLVQNSWTGLKCPLLLAWIFFFPFLLYHSAAWESEQFRISVESLGFLPSLCIWLIVNKYNDLEFILWGIEMQSVISKQAQMCAEGCKGGCL